MNTDDIKKMSSLMRWLCKMRLYSFAWAVRKFYTPVSKNALVLEVGSGGDPYPRSNVLLDAYEATRERHWVPLISDRPTVLGFLENLPFKDNSFDFEIDWDPPESEKTIVIHTFASKIKSNIRALAKSFFIKRQQNKNISIVEHLRCISCHGNVELISASEACCIDCDETYPISNGIYVMNKR
jgi:hypothetical protein